MINILRWILFIPLAFIASLIAGALGNWLGNFGIWVYEGSETLGWVFSGVGSSIGFMFIGMQVAPYQNERVKIILIITLFLLGLLSFVGSFFFGDSPAFIAGAVMALASLVCIKLSPEQILGGSEEKA